jgi:hypothetical protein
MTQVESVTVFLGKQLVKKYKDCVLNSVFGKQLVKKYRDSVSNSVWNKKYCFF